LKGKQAQTMNANALERYTRQMLFPSFGREGQEKLQTSHVLIAGVGGLGSPVAMYLTVSGIGEITLIDSDTVALSNLNRQLLHWEKDIGRKKVISAQEKLKQMNTTTRVHAVFLPEQRRDLRIRTLIELVEEEIAGWAA